MYNATYVSASIYPAFHPKHTTSGPSLSRCNFNTLLFSAQQVGGCNKLATQCYFGLSHIHIYRNKLKKKKKFTVYDHKIIAWLQVKVFLKIYLYTHTYLSISIFILCLLCFKDIYTSLHAHQSFKIKYILQILQQVTQL